MRAASLCVVLGLVSCGAPAPPPIVTVPTPPPDPKAARDPGAISVAAARAPSKLVVDGDLTEWGERPAPTASVPLLDLAGATAEANVPNPKDATTQVSVAFTGAALVAAISSRAAQLDELWLGVASRVPDLPELGQFGGRAGFVHLQCELEVSCYSVGEGDACQPDPQKPNPPEVAKACQGLLDRRAALGAAHAQRFSKLFALGPTGVRARLATVEDAALEPVSEATIVWRHEGGGTTAEVSIPLAALPRMSEAPLRRVGLVGAKGPDDIPANPEGWIGVALPEPVAFAPFAELRAMAMAREREVAEFDARVGAGFTGWEQPPGLSYQPGDALHIEAMTFNPYSTSTVTPATHDLYKRLGAIGGVEVGVVDLADRSASVGIVRAGRPIEVLKIASVPAGVVERGGELHLFSPTEEGWRVLAVTPEGGHREALTLYVPKADRESQAAPASRPKKRPAPAPWSDRKSEASAGFEELRFRAYRARGGIEVTYRWSEAARQYLGSERALPPLPRPARRAGTK